MSYIKRYYDNLVDEMTITQIKRVIKLCKAVGDKQEAEHFTALLDWKIDSEKITNLRGRNATFALKKPTNNRRR